MVSAEVLEMHRAQNRYDAALETTMGVLNATTARLVELIGQCIDERLWELEGCASAAHWAAVRCGLAPPRAHRLVRIAERRHQFPRVIAELAAGQLTEDHVGVIVAHAHPSHDADLTGAGSWSIGQLRRVIAALPVPEPEPSPDAGDDDLDEEPHDDPPAAERQPVDAVSGGWSDDGRYRARLDLGAGLGSLFETAMRSARTALYRDRAGHDADDDAELAGITAADAFDRLLHAGLEGLDPSTRAGRPPSERHQVLLHIDAERPERSRLDLGPTLSAADRRLLSCDCDLRTVLYRGSLPVALGRRQRVVGPVLRALIADRDQGCRIDGCGHRRWLHIHHLWHWEDGGPTDPDNLVALCPEHHRAVHRGDLRLIGDPTTPDGLLVTGRHGQPLPRPGPWRPPDEPPTGPRYRGPDRSEPLRRCWL